MQVIFCSDPLAPRPPGSAYEGEVSAAAAVGLDRDLIDYESLVDENDPLRDVRRVPEQSSPDIGIYRGWMLRPVHYRQLHDALASRGVRLINDPSAYTHCHYFPESCSIIEAYERVVRRFIELRSEDLNEGLVFREFAELEPMVKHTKSGMRLTKEFRIFFLDGEQLCSMPYWEEGDYEGTNPPIDRFRDVAQAVRSRFFTMDIAKRLDGDWMIVELGDGQVAALPRSGDALEFYKAPRKRWPVREQGEGGASPLVPLEIPCMLARTQRADARSADRAL